MRKASLRTLAVLLVLTLLLVFAQLPVFAEEETDLALNKPVTVSGTWDADPSIADQFLPKFANDGDRTTRWAGKEDDDLLFWITVDLGEVKNINKVVLSFQYSGNLPYDIESSSDGKTFNTIESGLMAINRVEAEDTETEDEVFTFTATPARYVRIISEGYITLWTFSVFGTKGDVPAATTPKSSQTAVSSATPPKTAAAATTVAATPAATTAASYTEVPVITAPPSDSPAASNIYPLLIGGIVAVLIVICVVVYIIFIRRKNKQS